MANNSHETDKWELCNQRQMADILGCTPKTVHNLGRRRRIPVIRVGSLVRYQPDLVIKALSEPRYPGDPLFSDYSKLQE